MSKYLRRLTSEDEYDGLVEEWGENGYSTPNICTIKEGRQVRYNRKKLFVYMYMTNNSYRLRKSSTLSDDEFNQLRLAIGPNNESLNSDRIESFYTYTGDELHDGHQYAFSKIMEKSNALKYNIYESLGFSQSFINTHPMFYVDSNLNTHQTVNIAQLQSEIIEKNSYNIVKTSQKFFLGPTIWWGIEHGSSCNGFSTIWNCGNGGPQSNISYYLIPQKIYVTCNGLNVINEPYEPRNYINYFTNANGMFVHTKDYSEQNTWSWDTKNDGSCFSKWFRDKNIYFGYDENGTEYTDESGNTRTCVNDITVYKTVLELKSIPQSMKEDVDNYCLAIEAIVNYSASTDYKVSITYNENDGFYLHPMLGRYLSYGLDNYEFEEVFWHPINNLQLTMPDGVTPGLHETGFLRLTGGKKDSWAGAYSTYNEYQTYDDFILSGGTLHSGATGNASGSNPNFTVTREAGHMRIGINKSGVDVTKWKWVLFQPYSQSSAFSGNTGSRYTLNNITITYTDDNSQTVSLDSSLISYGSGGTGVSVTQITNGYNFTTKANTTTSGAKYRFGFYILGLSASTVPSDRMIYIDFDTAYRKATKIEVKVSSYMAFGVGNTQMFDRNNVAEIVGGDLHFGNNYIQDP